MPELPEVETIRRDLESVLVGKKITGVDIRLPKIIRSNPRTFSRQLKGQRIAGIMRRAKLLIIELADSNRYVVLHLKMTGQLIYRHGAHVIAGGHSEGVMPVDNLPNKYTHVVITFTDRSVLYFNDLRQFGYLQLVDGQVLEDMLSAYGVEPLALVFTVAYLQHVLRQRRVSLKQVLLDQTAIAGLGNIYVDEACFYARVKPTRKAHRLTSAEVKLLHRGIRHILQQSIKWRGTTFNNYRDAHGRTGAFVRRLKVYGRGGKVCLRCRQGTITKVKIGGRGTHFCSVCQI